jgi:diketogulonate reductase-like aldo/keto reductase
MADVSTLTLNNGVKMPALGLGVFQTPLRRPEPR